jgi:carboxyl-terminal processing protease
VPRSPVIPSGRLALLVAGALALGALASHRATRTKSPVVPNASEPGAGLLVAGPTPPPAARRRADQPYPRLEIFAKVLSYVENNYVEDVDESKLVYGAVKGMLSTLDPHTVFLEPREYQSMREDTSGEFGGVGIEIAQKDDAIVVLAPIDDTPASRAGIKAGDVITAIDAASTRTMSVPEAERLLKGLPGTPVSLRLFRPGFAAARDFPLVRDRVRVVSVESRLLDGPVGYVKLKSFQDRTDQDLRKALATLRQQAGPAFKGLVLDLRNNPGGLLEQGVKVADRFLRAGVIVRTRGRNDRHPEEELAVERDTEPPYPLVVLVNAGTASASEIVAGALQDHRRAVIFGTTSFGKGSVQTVIELEDGSALKITIARYYTPSGRSIQERGIDPDVPVAANEAEQQLLREVNLVGHMRPEGPVPAVARVDAARVLGGVSLDEGIADVQLRAAVGALRGWDEFQQAFSLQGAARAP